MEINNSFPWLKDTLQFEEHGERIAIVTSLLLQFNLRARLVGINQIRSVYYPALEVDKNIELIHRLILSWKF
jgi:hypothetical protein